MLYGDDDTLWFVGGVLDLLKDLDPEMPYVITGGSPLTCPMSSQVGHPLHALCHHRWVTPDMP